MQQSVERGAHRIYRPADVTRQTVDCANGQPPQEQLHCGAWTGNQNCSSRESSSGTLAWSMWILSSLQDLLIGQQASGRGSSAQSFRPRPIKRQRDSDAIAITRPARKSYAKFSQ
jgi:hypothetical protein